MRKLLIVLLLSLLGCIANEPRLVVKTGNAQGSTYQIKYITTSSSDLDKEIDNDILRIFKEIDHSMSTWDATSMITQINETGDWIEVDTHFVNVLNRSLEIAEESNGDFDPTIGPLVRLWGFWFDELRSEVRPEQVQQTLEHVGYDKINIDGQKIRINQNSMIDFNAIAQGYTVDVIAQALEEKGINRYMVEVGGEVRTRGLNDKNLIWVIGVDKPQETIDNEERFQFILKLEDAALATSGNYRKFWVDEETGLKYSHTIDPKTGYPAKNNLLSASIITSTAMNADAYATLCMVRGLQDCKELLDKNLELEGYLIFSDNQGTWQEFVTNGFQKAMLE
jgi:thiamine biosynthesis lipoprotein